LFNYSLAALRFAKKANTVSKLQGEVLIDLWGHEEGICKIGHITNALNRTYWVDEVLETNTLKGGGDSINSRKKGVGICAFQGSIRPSG
jgi:starch phosphorylase